LSAFFASFFKTARDRQRAFVALLDSSAGVPTTQMQALFAPQAFSSSPLHEVDDFAFLTFAFAGGEPDAFAALSDAADDAPAPAGFAAAAALFFLAFGLCLVAGGAGAAAGFSAF
jgi:hypothetical protein